MAAFTISRNIFARLNLRLSAPPLAVAGGSSRVHDCLHPSLAAAGHALLARRTRPCWTVLLGRVGCTARSTPLLFS